MEHPLSSLFQNPVITALIGSAVGSLIASVVGIFSSWMNSRTMLRIKEIDQAMSDQRLILEVALQDHEHTAALMKEYAEKFGQDVDIYPAFPRMVFYKDMNEILKKNLKPTEMSAAIRKALDNQGSLEKMIQDYSKEKGRLVA